MAKGKKSDNLGRISFGKKRTGKPKKSRGPKEKHVSEYRGQGR